jgi:uncharacterized protein GlcG (DUF336 family)
MANKDIQSTVNKIIAAVEELIPTYVSNPEDRNIGNGNVAICIIDELGVVHGKLFGTDLNRIRQSYKIAWIKASQVWITGLKTGEFETLAYAGKIDEDKFGIMRPDYIGWEGGQPITLRDGTKLSVGFSGFRGINDLDIVVKAIEKVGL